MYYNSECDSGYYVSKIPRNVKDFGYVNGWTAPPEEVVECGRKGHVQYSKPLGRCNTEYGCEICGYMFRVDSSD